MTVKTKTKVVSIFEFEQAVADLDEAFKRNEQAVKQLNAAIDGLNEMMERRSAKKSEKKAA